MKNSDAQKAYDDYMKSLYSAENIAKAGGVKNHAKIIRDFKRKERMITIKENLWAFRRYDLPFIIVVAIIAIVAKMFFFPSITYINILVVTAIAAFIKVVIF